MTSPFDKRVDILTDWHNRFPDANVDLLAELILDVWQEAEQHIIKLLKDRHTMTLDENTNILAFSIPVDRKSAALVTEALIWAIEGEDVLTREKI